MTHSFLNKRILLLLNCITPLLLLGQTSQNSGNLRLNATNVDQIVAAMTLEEKASLVVGTAMPGSGDSPVIGSVRGRVQGAAGNTNEIKRLGIAGTVLCDGPAGLRIDPVRDGVEGKTFYATAWPVGTLLASSWDTTLVHNVGKALGNEVKEYGADVLLAPGVNIQRNPLNGRNFEYYSEDPFVTGTIASAMISGIQSNGVGVSIKHFAANNEESNRYRLNAVISERALREIYLRGFEIAVKKSHPWTVMSAYNKINGVFCSESYDLLTSILRNDWGYQGIVMTDWFAGKDRSAQMKAGNDLIEPGSGRDVESIVNAVKKGDLEEKILDRNVKRILNFILKTPSYKGYQYSNNPDLAAHAAYARKAASESMVLLKNQGSLPIKGISNIALFGVASYHTIIGGTGSGDVNKKYQVSIVNGLKNAGLNINKELQALFASHILKDSLAFPHKPALGKPHVTPELTLSLELINKMAKETDIAIYTLCRNAGEGADREVEGDFDLTANEKSQVQQISHAFHALGKKVIVLLNIGGVVETDSWQKDVDAILLTWQPGQEAGNAIADVLTGKVNPSGKLATTFPVKYEDVSSAKYFPGIPAEKPQEATYQEGIYVGYRYNNSFGIKVSYPFGYGLSYTTFEYKNLKLNSTTFNGEITVTVTVTNTGKVAGKEVVQLYLSAPVKSMDKPTEELKGFAKTNLLKSGASQTISFTLNARDMASFNTDQSAWIADSGIYSVKIGASSEDIKLKQDFTLGKDLVVEKVNKALTPQVQINELRR